MGKERVLIDVKLMSLGVVICEQDAPHNEEDVHGELLIF